MAFRLPPLNSLRLFEAAGRHLSFKLAAVELGVTPSAVSHGIQTLEEWLGTALFARGGRGLSLTEAGSAYLPAVQEALTTLAGAADRIPRPGARRSLAISTAPTFGARLLLPRLAAFQALHPEVAVAIDTTRHAVAFPRDGVDVAIRMGRGDWPELEAVPVLSEVLVPVCAPALRDRLGDPCDAPLIHVNSVTQDWEAWSRRSGISLPPCRRSVMVDTIGMALEAALQGLGVAMGRLPIFAEDMAAGRLVPVLGPPVRCETGYWLVGAPGSMARPEIAAFRDWLLREMGPLEAEAAASMSVPHLPLSNAGLSAGAPAA